ncbi:hypothetical protein QR680_012656 [Steinernema hermaphroditum]|uniref:CMP/dCMP-type deaminase domain-containing protein n=1 Tax=Steinernema hermaphroditum TaxID=289476 RepID=A0AA39I4B8_9BILA|nr:hypothetical protein QR680_012656 [Steinernema hermaphroditum]
MKAVEVSMEFLEEAFALAEAALENNEVPVGCVFVYRGKIIGRGRNDVNRTKNPTRHAEMVAFDELREWCAKEEKALEEVLAETELYVSLEPCIMCGSAMYQLKIKKIVYGASNERFGGIDSVAGKKEYAAEHEIEIVCGIMRERAIQLLKDFYDRQNPFAPPEKRKIKKNSLS